MARALANRTGACSANSRPFDSAVAPLKVTDVIVIPSAGAVEESRRSDGREPVRVAMVDAPSSRDVSTSGLVAPPLNMTAKAVTPSAVEGSRGWIGKSPCEPHRRMFGELETFRLR